MRSCELDIYPPLYHIENPCLALGSPRNQCGKNGPVNLILLEYTILNVNPILLGYMILNVNPILLEYTILNVLVL